MLKRASLTDPLPDLAWLVEPWIPRDGITILSGDGGVGKSWLALDLAVAISSNHTWLGIQAPQPQGVLLIDEDGQAIGTQRRLRSLISARDLNPSILGNSLFHSPPQGLNIESGEDYANILLAAKEINAGLIIVDALVCLHAREESSATEMRHIMRGRFQRLVRESGAAVLILHHVTKPPQGQDIGIMSRDDLNALRGSTEIKNACDCMLTASFAGGQHKLKMSRSRLIPRELWPAPITYSIESHEESTEIIWDLPHSVDNALKEIRARDLIIMGQRGAHKYLCEQGFKFSRATIQRAFHRVAQGS